MTPDPKPPTHTPITRERIRPHLKHLRNITQQLKHLADQLEDQEMKLRILTHPDDPTEPE